jgi:hypothetical protein
MHGFNRLMGLGPWAFEFAIELLGYSMSKYRMKIVCMRDAKIRNN